MIIGVYGNGIGAGKTYTARMMADMMLDMSPMRLARIVSFSAPAKMCLAAVGWDGEKTPDARRALGMICDAHRLIVPDYPDYVVRAATRHGVYTVIFDDLRRQDEYSTLRRAGAYIVEVRSSSAHPDSVLELEHGFGDYVIENDRGDISGAVAEILADINRKQGATA